MPSEATSDPKFEIGHILFIDVIGYSKLNIDEQTSLLRDLNNTVQQAQRFRRAEAEGQLVCLPTGDGMALVFRDSAESPAQCALEISAALQNHRGLPVRMGIHSGPVNEVKDVNNRVNVAGAGINMAQRIMDCGDAGHILVSKRVAEDLEHYARWKPYLRGLGRCEVKHGVTVEIFNLYNSEVGNPRLPEKLTPKKKRTNMFAAALGGALRRMKWRLLFGLLVPVVGLISVVWIGGHLFFGSSLPLAGGPKSYSNRSYGSAKWSKIYAADRLFPAKAIFHNLVVWDRENFVVTGETEDGQLFLRRQSGQWKIARGDKIPGGGAISSCRMIGKDRFICLRSVRRGMVELGLWEADGSRKLGSVPAGSSLFALAPDTFCGMEERLGYWKYSGSVIQQFEKTARESFVLRDDNVVAQIKNPRWNKDEAMLVANVRDVTVVSPGNAVGLWSTSSGSCATVRYRNGRWYLGTEVAGFSPQNVPSKAWFVDHKNFVGIGSDKVARCVDGKLTLQSIEVGGFEYPANALTVVWGRDMNHYWTADFRGNVFHWDGIQWKLLVRGPDVQNRKFEAIWPAHNGSVIGITTNEVYVLE